MRIFRTIAAILCPVVLAGCSGVPVTTPIATTTVSGKAVRGIVHGGQQPIANARVYLYAANTSGYGGASISILTSASGGTEDSNGNYYVTTGPDGSFNIASENCTTANPEVYLYSIGGNSSGNPNSGANPAIGLLAALGPCTAENFPSVYAVVNEVSTVATAYAIAGFATDATHVSSSSTELAATGVAHAFADVANLESVLTSQGNPASFSGQEEPVNFTGEAATTTPAGNGAAPQQLVNTLANILAACINSETPFAPCSTLFSNAKNGITSPTDTATAAINIAHNPGANISALYGLQTADAPFQTSLSGEPNDFTLAITYSGGGLDGTGKAPEGVAVDGDGNVWVPNHDASTLSEFKYDGTVLSGTGGFGQGGLDSPTSVAIDTLGNAWVANFNGDSLSEFNSNGEKISGPPGFTGSGLNTPYGIAIDNVGHTWVANFGGNNLSEFQASGAPLSGANGYPVGALIGPAGIAADASGNVWAVDYNASNYLIVETNANGEQTADPSGFSGGGLNAPYGVAIDSSGNIWTTNQAAGGSLSEFSSSGRPVSETGYTGGGLLEPYGIAIDGAGNVWAADIAGYCIVEFNSSGMPISGSSGYYSSYPLGITKPFSLAIDPSGNVWVATQNGSSALTEFVGAAAPVVTPLAAGAAYNELGTRP
jgi:YD repeat-containing protein